MWHLRFIRVTACSRKSVVTLIKRGSPGGDHASITPPVAPSAFVECARFQRWQVVRTSKKSTCSLGERPVRLVALLPVVRLFREPHWRGLFFWGGSSTESSYSLTIRTYSVSLSVRSTTGNHDRIGMDRSIPSVSRNCSSIADPRDLIASSTRCGSTGASRTQRGSLGGTRPIDASAGAGAVSPTHSCSLGAQDPPSARPGLAP